MTLFVRRLSSAAAFVFAASAISGTAFSAEMPAVKVSDSNPVAECATPGRLMAFLKTRNPNLDEKFDTVAQAYMQAGQELGLRWDYGFFQMLVETGFLTFKGTVKPEQNNFAGLGATGGGVRGESFKDVATGARAHLEHLAMYAGEKLDNPTAERTRLVLEQGVLTKWQKSISGPMTFAHLTKQWAPTSKGYASDIKNVADRFFNGACNEADPAPGLMAGATAKIEPTKTASVEPPPVPVADDTVGDKLAKKANEDARADGGVKSGLGTAALAGAADDQKPIMPVKILNAPPVGSEAPAETAAVAPAAPQSPAAPESAKAQPASLLASLSAFGKSMITPPSAPAAKADAPKVEGALPNLSDAKPEKLAAPDGKCRVFTASYGGGKSVIVKAVVDKQVNYTVLDVNEGAEKREADAYITAYAKGGETVGGDFRSQDQALDKAFELCPEG